VELLSPVLKHRTARGVSGVRTPQLVAEYIASHGLPAVEALANTKARLSHDLFTMIKTLFGRDMLAWGGATAPKGCLGDAGKLRKPNDGAHRVAFTNSHSRTTYDRYLWSGISLILAATDAEIVSCVSVRRSVRLRPLYKLIYRCKRTSSHCPNNAHPMLRNFTGGCRSRFAH
jgi:hypothetical protein